jgi:hypothetical protein
LSTKNDYAGIRYQPLSGRYVVTVGKTRVSDHESIDFALEARERYIASKRLEDQEARNDASQ